MNYEMPEEIRLTQQMVQIESSNPGTFEAAMSEFVYDWLQRNTSAEIFREPVHPGRDNIVAILRGKSRAHNLTYICHMDTMPAGEGWEHPPLSAEIIDGKLYGRGSCDMKAGLAAAMLAFRNLSRLGKPLNYDFQLIATVNEEDAMTGAEQAGRLCERGQLRAGRGAYRQPYSSRSQGQNLVRVNHLWQDLPRKYAPAWMRRHCCHGGDYHPG